MLTLTTRPRRLARSLLTLALFSGGSVCLGQQSASAAILPTPIPANSPWLTTVNYYRQMAGVPPVTENASWSAGAVNHSRWMVQNSAIAHDEPASGAFVTPEGDLAGNNGNVAVSSNPATTAREHIDLWMTGPFHAIGILRPQLQQVGYGQFDNPAAPRWRSGATLDVLRGLNFSAPIPSTPILFPGNGTTIALGEFITEQPNPLDFCGWTGEAGLPVFAMMPEDTSTGSASMTGPSGPVQVCTLGSQQTTGTASQILAADNAIIVVPRNPLAQGTYTVTIATPSRTVQWSFTVDPSVADGPPTPLPSTTAIGPLSTFQPVTPARLVDTRSGLGATRLRANQVTRIDVSGQKGVPASAVAVSANFTIVEPDQAGFLTIYPCGPMPDVSTLNFDSRQVVPNQATVPLDGSGDMCVTSTSSGHLLVDVNGALLPSAPDRYTAITPQRILDTRSGLGGATRQSPGSTITLQVEGRAGVPAHATAVALNVTAVNPAGTGYITVFPCGAMPDVSNLNTSQAATRPNLVVVPLSAAGTVCLFTAEAQTDLLADVAGYYSPSATQQFTALSPMRMLDTRSARTDLNGGSGASPIPARQTVRVVLAGTRGVPAGAKAVSINITVTGARGGGFLTAFPCGSVPDVSNVNFAASDTANAAQVTLDSTGAICLWSDMATHMLFDINGVWA
jgi:Cysteine-rich secretory protein family